MTYLIYLGWYGVTEPPGPIKPYPPDILSMLPSLNPYLPCHHLGWYGGGGSMSDNQANMGKVMFYYSLCKNPVVKQKERKNILFC